MRDTFLTNFGFNTSPQIGGFKDIKFGSQSDKKKILWTFLIYVFLSVGLLLGKAVNQPLDPIQGIKYEVFTFSIIVASFIIGLAILSPLLRVISRFHRGQLSWQHCLSAFTIGFFSNLTFTTLISSFLKIV